MSERALHLIALSRPKEALVELDKSFDPESARDWWVRALALFGASRLEESLQAVGSGLKVNPDYKLLFDVAARVHFHRGDLARAEEAVLAGLRIETEDADMLALYARIVAKAGQVDKAKKLIAEARRVDPENTTAMHVEAAIATSSGDDIEALSISREILAIDPENTYAHLVAGQTLHDRGDVHEAAEHLRTAVVNNPNDSRAAEIARENLAWRHPLMWPLRPVHKFGAAKVWVVGIVLLLLARSTQNSTVMVTVGLTWLAYVLYSWVVPPIVRQMVK